MKVLIGWTPILDGFNWGILKGDMILVNELIFNCFNDPDTTKAVSESLEVIEFSELEGNSRQIIGEVFDQLEQEKIEQLWLEQQLEREEEE